MSNNTEPHTEQAPFSTTLELFREQKKKQHPHLVLEFGKYNEYRNGYEVMVIATRPHHSSGIGTRIMEELCQLADDHQQSLWVFVCPASAIDLNRLFAWYKRFNFEPCSPTIENYLRRPPTEFTH